MEASRFLWVQKNHYSLSKEADILGLRLPLKKFNSNPKLYIPSSINIWKKVLTKAIWTDKKWAGFWQICQYIK